MTAIRIIAAVVDTQRLTLYKEDGSTILINQGDARIRPLVDKVIPALEADAFCDLTDEDLASPSVYRDAEKELGGFAQFLKVFKSTMETLVEKFAGQIEQSDVVEPRRAGIIPPVKSQSAGQAAVNEIMQHATTTASSTFNDDVTEEQTIVALLPDGTMIPGMEKLTHQLQATILKLGSPEGIKNFLQRVASVNRGHSVQDLLVFMEKGELPIADDGCVLVYKLLRHSDKEGVFVDCHTGKVTQRVGSYVHMDEKLVDANRCQDCSNGLHVARRDYLKNFSGDVCVLAKLAPEDVIAVPEYDARKLRARAYHIVALLSDEDYREVCANRPMKDSVLLGNVAAGNHIGIIERVEITQHKGEGVVISKVEGAVEEAPELIQEKKSESLDSVKATEKKTSSVDAADLAKKVGAGQTSRQAKAEALLQNILAMSSGKDQQRKAQELIALKKTAKVGWERLGISQATAERVIAIAEGKTKVEPAAEKPAPAKKVGVKQFNPEATAKAKKPKAPSHLNGVKTGQGTPRERIQDLLKGGIQSVGAAQAALSLKKKAKKSWEALGVSANDVDHILKLAGK